MDEGYDEDYANQNYARPCASCDEPSMAGFECDGEGGSRTEQSRLVDMKASTSLPRSCMVLTCNDPGNPFGGEQTFYLVGTAHVSMASCDDVRKVISEIKPEVLPFPALCTLHSLVRHFPMHSREASDSNTSN